MAFSGIVRMLHFVSGYSLRIVAACTCARFSVEYTPIVSEYAPSSSVTRYIDVSFGDERCGIKSSAAASESTDGVNSGIKGAAADARQCTKGGSVLFAEGARQNEDIVSSMTDDESSEHRPTNQAKPSQKKVSTFSSACLVSLSPFLLSSVADQPTNQHAQT